MEERRGKEKLKGWLIKRNERPCEGSTAKGVEGGCRGFKGVWLVERIPANFIMEPLGQPRYNTNTVAMQ